MSRETILVASEVDLMLQGAKRVFERDGHLQTHLFILVLGDELYSYSMGLSDTPEEKARDMMFVSHQLRARGLPPQEAVMMSEAWFMNALEAPAAMRFTPGEHPARREAIVVVGRSADRRRCTQVVQPFTRVRDNRPRWSPPTDPGAVQCGAARE